MKTLIQEFLQVCINFGVKKNKVALINFFENTKLFIYVKFIKVIC